MEGLQLGGLHNVASVGWNGNMISCDRIVPSVLVVARCLGLTPTVVRADVLVVASFASQGRVEVRR